MCNLPNWLASVKVKYYWQSSNFLINKLKSMFSPSVLEHSQTCLFLKSYRKHDCTWPFGKTKWDLKRKLKTLIRQDNRAKQLLAGIQGYQAGKQFNLPLHTQKKPVKFQNDAARKLVTLVAPIYLFSHFQHKISYFLICRNLIQGSPFTTRLSDETLNRGPVS